MKLYKETPLIKILSYFFSTLPRRALRVPKAGGFSLKRGDPKLSSYDTN